MQQIRLKSNPPSKIEGVGGADVPKALFYMIGKFSKLPYHTKSPPGRIALRRSSNMSLKRPAAGGESCFAGFLFICRISPVFGKKPPVSAL